MDQYILNLLPRIIAGGRKLNQIEALVDKVWVKYGEEDFETYRYRRNNIVLVSLAGIVEERKWEILPPNGLYISKEGRGLMYRQAVVFESIMLVQLESVKYQPVLFYDEAKIPDGNVIGYLKSLFSPVVEKPLPETPLLYKELVYKTKYGSLIINKYLYNSTLIDNEAHLNSNVAPDRKYEIIGDAVFKWIKVKNGKVSDFEQH